MSYSLVFLVLSTSPILATSDTYFTSDSDPFLGRVVPTRPAIHAEIDAALRSSPRGDVQGRLMRLENELRPTFDALPKNKHGRVPSTVVRYLLHRHFLRQHAWLVFGLAPDGAAWNARSVDEILKDHVPKRVYELIREHVQERGLQLHETAVLAALIENVVHDDAVGRLHFVWQIKGLPSNGRINVSAMQDVVDAYMATYIPGVVLEGRTQEEVVKDAIAIYPSFHTTQSFGRELIAMKMLNINMSLERRDAEEIVVDVSERYGKWQDSECKDLKSELMAMEGPGLGRVTLGSFYKKAVVDKRWFFTESVPYLRDLGALDESNPGRPILMVPNYMNSPSQYIAASHFYAVSCLDECEPIIAYFEARLASPHASVSDILRLVATSTKELDISTSAVTGFARKMLESIAAKHDGSVPLHGRLFAQWMHHMYPAQCAYPHRAGSTHPSVPEDFERRTGVASVETEESMQARVQNQHAEANEVDSQLWDLQEELLTDAADSRSATSVEMIDLVYDIVDDIVDDMAESPYQWSYAVGSSVAGFVLVMKLLKLCFLSAAPHAASVPLLLQVNA